MRIVDFSIFIIFLKIKNLHSRVIKDNEEQIDEIKRLFKEDISIFEGKGLWFYDDKGNPVKATMNSTLLSRSLFDLRKNTEDNIVFRIYTRKSKKKYRILKFKDDVSLLKSGFVARKPTKIITHGWMNSYRSEACTLIRDAYLKQGDYNVIVVDWSGISKSDYPMAALKVKDVGRHVALMIDFLISRGMNPSTTTLVGHSLGAHVMGIAGHFSKYTIEHIVGLDPALPLFSLAMEGSRLSSNDADFVEIIHTNAGFLGYKSDIGDADFYPNGGSIQFGCNIDLVGACSHSRAYKFFAESILSKNGFYGRMCRNFRAYKRNECTGTWALMGDSRRKRKIRGTFYLRTRPLTPYALGRRW